MSQETKSQPGSVKQAILPSLNKFRNKLRIAQKVVYSHIHCECIHYSGVDNQSMEWE